MSVRRHDTVSGSTDAMARAVGQYVLGEADLGEAADRAGVSAWELHEVLVEAGVIAEQYEN